MRERYQFLNVLTTAFMAGMAGSASPHKQERVKVSVDDSIITSKVKAALLHEPALINCKIGVLTHEGQVRLSGLLRSKAAMDKAMQTARQVGGVVSVRNDMHLS